MNGLSYLVGLCGLWLFTDGLISIRLYYGKLAEEGGRKQDWKRDHSIRLIRMVIGLFLVAVAAPIW